MVDNLLLIIVDTLEIRNDLIVSKSVIDNVYHVISLAYLVLIDLFTVTLADMELNVLMQHFHTGRVIYGFKILHRAAVDDAEDRNDRNILFGSLKKTSLQCLHVFREILQRYHE